MSDASTGAVSSFGVLRNAACLLPASIVLPQVKPNWTQVLQSLICTAIITYRGFLLRKLSIFARISPCLNLTATYN